MGTPTAPPAVARPRRARVARVVAVVGGLLGVIAAVLLVAVPWDGPGPAVHVLAIAVPAAAAIGASAALTTVLPSSEPTEQEAVDVALLVVDVAIVMFALPAVGVVGVLIGGP
jgi:hypothetical protein